jgi:predicted ATPase/DNA-binding winged helix-turn-helix (wHTH) protein
MSIEVNRRSPTYVSFGPFRLFVEQRLLERSGVPLHLGARALEILIVLVERANKIVSKEELLERVWPDVVVDEGSVRVSIAALRKTLGEGEAGARYVMTLSGRGYCFVAPLSYSGPSRSTDPKHQTPEHPQGLPARLKRMVGRDETVHEISARLMDKRFVTIAGPGGIGKTTVAVSVGHQVLEEFAGAVCFIDLGTLSDPLLVPGAIASMMGLAVRSDDPMPSLINYLRDRRVLLILDSCEHVIETVAALAESAYSAAPGVHVLATSRESLRVEGEHVYRLPPLDSPPVGIELSAERTLEFPAVQLFVERVAAAGRSFELNDHEAGLVGEICRRLDGIALAIELAAGRVNAYSISETLQLLHDRFRLLRGVRRTALPRHQTLSAMLDWSYNLLSASEQMMLRRLSAFVGLFTLDAVAAVAAGGTPDDSQVVDILASLVEKSMVAASAGDTITRYRLLDTTRAYAVSKFVASGEANAISRRHANYYIGLLQRDMDPLVRSQLISPRGYADQLDNLRAALEWSFSDSGEIEIGIALATAAAHMLLEMSLLTECRRWSEAALAALNDNDRGTRREMELQAALGQSLMLAKGNSDIARQALSKSLELAEKLGDLPSQLRLLGRLIIFDHRAGNCDSASALARRSETVAGSIGDPASTAEANWSLGFSNYFAGDQRSADANWTPSLVEASRTDYRVNRETLARMRCGLIAVRWLRGFPDQSAKIARDTLDESIGFKDPSALCICLIFAGFAFLRMGHWSEAAKTMERIISHATKHSLPPFEAIGLAMRGLLAIRRGEAEAGVELIRDAVEALHAGQYELHNPVFLGGLAEGLAMTGRFDDALATVDEAMASVQRNGQLFSLPEFMRIKGEILISTPKKDPSEAEGLFLESIELARRQSALSWQLRAATSLAGLWDSKNRADDAMGVLAPAYNDFSEGFETADLQIARRLLDGLQKRMPTRGLIDRSV